MGELDFTIIGQNIKILRVRQGFNQTQLAQTLGISQTHMSNLEHGRVCISLKILVNLAAIFNCNVDNILYLHEKVQEEEPQEKDKVSLGSYTAEDIQTLFKFIKGIQNPESNS